MVEKGFSAALDQLEPVQKFVLEQLRDHPFSERVRAQLDVAVEEIFVNIARYAYPEDHMGRVTIRCRVDQNPLRITVQFVDANVAVAVMTTSLPGMVNVYLPFPRSIVGTLDTPDNGTTRTLVTVYPAFGVTVN